MRSNILEAITGAFVIAAAGFFFHYAYKASGTAPTYGYAVNAQFDRIDGLIVGNDVKMSGVKVGDVSRITLDPKTFMAVVELSLDDSVKLPIDTSAQIVSESLMGGKYIALVPGGDDVNLKPGEQIIYTQSSMNFENLIGKFLFSKNDDNNENSGKAAS